MSETQVAVRSFGREPVFIFDPVNTSNRPEPGDPVNVWWPIYPQFVRDFFVRAFGEGLRDGSPGSRVVESEWRRALSRLGDSVNNCPCGASIFYDPIDPAKACWNCHAATVGPLILDVRQRSVVMAVGATITEDHLKSNEKYRNVLAQIEAHPNQSGVVVLRNTSEQVWLARPQGEEEVSIPPGRRFAVRPGTISFGEVHGSIRATNSPT